ncbi:c-type cytochrome [Aeoliella mucimassa]|uniref:Cytochrome c n=1 Tax=Aeoliella mucimassa TaxID=2527972 RepID=A0A518AKA1_9BACT|nr:cytochrome c [Aeoliella mucimassa]QDU55159.1 Cytochrome c [Aeoliella mucimassa]
MFWRSSKSRLLAGFGLLASLALVAGCETSAPEFQPNGMAAADARLILEHQQQIAAVMLDLFGTPDDPQVPDGVELDLELLTMASGAAGYEGHIEDDDHLQRGLYRQHCATCHGVTGRGRGPAAGMMVPAPRDFTAGLFKWKSTYLKAKPTDDDLRDVLIRGIPGTAMPSFALLEDEKDQEEEDKRLDALVEYTKYLAIRGAFEQQLIATVGEQLDADFVEGTTDEPFDPATDEADQQIVDQLLTQIAADWRDAESQVVVPDPALMPGAERSEQAIADSIAAGQELYKSLRTKCTDCHGPAGKGMELKEMDVWNQQLADYQKETGVLEESIEFRQAQRHQSEAELVADRQLLVRRKRAADRQLYARKATAHDLTTGVFRGGSEPIDLFHRIHQGIAGTPMPGQGSPRPGVDGALSEQEIWQLVDYIQSISK